MTAEVRARLDDKIAALTLLLSNLRTHRNTFSPVSRLPPEVLASIFIHRARHHHQDQYPTEYRVPDWVNVSHVCRHWRDVALNCSALWSFLFVSSRRWTNELLARSMTAPLKVRVASEFDPIQSQDSESKGLNFLTQLAPQTDRIQDLCLRLAHHEAERILPTFSSPAPLLQSLEISVFKNFSYFRVSERALVSRILFGGDVPALRKLELINYAFPLTSPTFRGLTVLKLRDLGTSYQPTLAELKVALSYMRDLGHLHLVNALPSARNSSTGQSYEGSERLSFPQLSRLSIVAPFSTVVLLLTSFDLPMQTEVRLRCCCDAGDEDYTPIYPLLAKRFIAPEWQGFALAPIIRTSFIESVSGMVGFVFSATEHDSGRRAFSVSTKSYSLGELYEDWDCSIPLKVDIVLRALLPREDLVGNIYSSVPLTNLQSAHFSFGVGITLPSTFWLKTFGHLRELRYIKLHEVDLKGLVRALSLVPYHRPKHDGENLELGPGRVFAPALEELELYGVDFSNCHGWSQGDPDDCSYSALYLHDVLSSRQAEGHGLRRIVITKCMDVHDYEVGGLKELVTDVNWDGITNAISTEEMGGSDDRGPRGHLGITRFYNLHQ